MKFEVIEVWTLDDLPEGATIAQRAAAEKRAAKKARAAAGPMVECRECGKHFRTKGFLPECPRCHGCDIELAVIDRFGR